MIITFEHIAVRRFGKLMFPQTNFAIPVGACIGIYGKNGAGKTQFLQVLSGKIPIVEGNVQKKDSKLLSALCHLVESNIYRLLPMFMEHFYQQRYHAYGSEAFPTVGEFLLNKRNIFIESPTRDESFEAKVSDWLSFFDILHLKNDSVIQLSNGEQKRMMLIKALLNDPEVLLLDEPYIGLDKEGVYQLNRVLLRLLEKGKSIVIVSADACFPEFCHSMYQVEEGKISPFSTQSLPKKEVIKETRINTATITSPEELIFFDNIAITSNGRKLLNNITWKVAEGERWWIQGNNGSGKSTLLSLVFADHPQAYAQSIHVFGIPRGEGHSIWEVKQKIGYLSPELQLQFDHRLSCQQIIGSGTQENLPIERKLSEQTLQHSHALMEKLEIGHLSERHFTEISTGEQRMVLLLRALIRNPTIIILDEPFQGIDVWTRQRMLQLISEYIHLNPRVAILFTTHQYDVIPQFITHTIQLKQGVMMDGGVYKLNEFEEAEL